MLLTYAFPDFVEFKGEDDVIGILTELTDESLPPAEGAALDVSHGVSKHRTQVPHLYTTFDLHQNITKSYILTTECLVH